MADRKAFDAIFGKQSALTPDPLARPDSPTARFLAERYAVGDAPTDSGYYGDYRTDPENKVEERGIILPGAKYSDGKVHPAWPAIVHDAWQGMKAFETADPTDNSPEATARLSKAAFDAAGLAMTGSLAVPRPSNAVGTFGGKLAKTADQPSAGDFLKERYGSSTSGAGPTGSAVNDPAAKELTLYRGVDPSRGDVAGAKFYSPDRKVAEMYAGTDGSVSETPITFRNLLSAPSWQHAKQSLGLDGSTTMPELIKAAGQKGYDGLSFKTTNGIEYVHIPDAVNDPTAQAKSFWDAVKPLDSKLDGTAARAMDNWVGGGADAMARGAEGGLMVPGPLESLPPQQLDAMAAPVRDLLRQTYGDTITVYRGEGGGNPSTGRVGALMSYTTDPQVAEQFAGVQTKALPIISDAEIAAAERQLATAGEVSIAGKTYRQQPGQKYVDIIDRDGNFVTDTDSLRTELAGINEWRAGLNAQRDDALKNVRAVELPVDQVVWATDRFGQKEIIARTGGGDGAITLPPMRDAPSDPAQYIKTSDYDKALNTPYASGASSRQVPFSGPLPPVGSWRMADRTGLYGRDIEHLRQFDPNDLLLPEIREGKLDPTKRGDDARYADWMREGKKPPPIEVLQMDDGRFRVMDGHRRALAAQQAGQPIEAWVSYSVPTGKVDAYGNPMKTSLTYELAHPTVDRTAASTPPTGSLNQTTSPQDFLRERYGTTDSAVKDAPLTGPMRVYHGTSAPQKFDKFNRPPWMTESPEIASAAAYFETPPEIRHLVPENLHFPEGRVYPLDINPQNPFVVKPGESIDQAFTRYGYGDSGTDPHATAAARGHDFFIYDGTGGDFGVKKAHRQIVPLQPQSVKSSTTGDLLYSNPKESAALPSAVKALENRALPMDLESKLARAREMGFDTDAPAYRGLRKPYSEDEAKSLYYQMFTDNPREAAEYGSNVVEAYLRRGNNLAVDAGGRNFNAVPTDGLPEPFLGLGDHVRTDEIAHKARELGYDSVSFKNLYDNATDKPGQTSSPPKPPAIDDDALLAELGITADDIPKLAAQSPPASTEIQPWERKPANIDVIFDPKNVRSVNATFDPAQSHSANLLASNPKTSAAVPVGVKAVEGNAAKNAATHAADDYRGQHGAPDHESGSPLHDVTANGIYPSDFYGPMGRRYYGTGEDAMDAKTFGIIEQMKGKPNRPITVYRAVPHEPTKAEQLAVLESQMAQYMRRGTVPDDAKLTGSKWYNDAHERKQAIEALPDDSGAISTINPGDWVTINRDYARDHGVHALGGKYKIISQKVPARELFTAGDSIHEWGWSPQRPTSE